LVFRKHFQWILLSIVGHQSAATAAASFYATTMAIIALGGKLKGYESTHCVMRAGRQQKRKDSVIRIIESREGRQNGECHA